jgi:hypothetical protein
MSVAVNAEPDLVVGRIGHRSHHERHFPGTAPKGVRSARSPDERDVTG